MSMMAQPRVQVQARMPATQEFVTCYCGVPYTCLNPTVYSPQVGNFSRAGSGPLNVGRCGRLRVQAAKQYNTIREKYDFCPPCVSL